MRYERPNIQRLAPYVPGEQPSFLETGGTDGVIKLNTNENPYPTSPKVMQGIAAMTPEALRLYPPADAAGFRHAAAVAHGVDPAQIIATNGGDELLRLLITVYCTPGTRGRGGIGMTAPSYTLYEVLAHIQDTPVTVIDRTDAADGGFALPDDYAQRLNDAGCELAFIVNPHAPSGRLESVDRLRALAQDFKGVLVIDEAYCDFAPHNALSLLQEGFENVVILRTLSKGYSLAGLRFAYGLSNAPLIEMLHKARDSYNVDILAQAAATAAVSDQTYLKAVCGRVVRERARMTAALRERGFTVPESHSNFLLATVPQDSPVGAKPLYQALKDRRILVRYFSTPRLADRLRISVGTPEQNDAVLDGLAVQGLGTRD